MLRDSFIVTLLSYAELEALGFATAMVSDQTRRANAKQKTYATTLSALAVRLVDEWEDAQFNKASTVNQDNSATGSDPETASTPTDAESELARLRRELSVQKACTVAGRDEIARLREAIRRLADQDATLSARNGNVTVTIDATLTDEEREAIKTAVGAMCLWMADNNVTEDESMRRAVIALRSLLERTK